MEILDILIRLNNKCAGNKMICGMILDIFDHI